MTFKNSLLYVFHPLLESQTFAISSPVSNNDLYDPVWKGSYKPQLFKLKVDNTIHQVNHYSVNNAIFFPNILWMVISPAIHAHHLS